jgi:hypothetical protein
MEGVFRNWNPFVVHSKNPITGKPYQKGRQNQQTSIDNGAPPEECSNHVVIHGRYPFWFQHRILCLFPVPFKALLYMIYKISGCAEDCREPRPRAALTGRIHQFQNGMPPTSPREDNAAVARQGAPIVGSRSSLIVLFLKHGLQLVPQLGRIFVTMRGNRMLHRLIEYFLFRARNFQCAVLLARVIPAIDRFSHNRI